MSAVSNSKLSAMIGSCGHLSASSHSLRFILSLRMNLSFVTSRSGQIYMLNSVDVKHLTYILADIEPHTEIEPYTA